MSSLYEQRLQAVADNGGGTLLAGSKRGIEKECLRITPEGLIASTAHPVALGSALTNRFITTDYSEALLEFVTPPVQSAWAATQFLCDVHQYTYASIGDELLWPFSMPCRLRTEADIPVAQDGSSNIGRMKTIYRKGLGHRYGRYMQAIAGIHFNYSLPDKYWEVRAQSERAGDITALKSESYLGLVRNVRRMDWLLLYLFGASPAVCRSFLAGVPSNLEQLDTGTCYGKWATSLRMSDLGYQNSNQSALVVSANSLEEYVRDLSSALVSPNEDYVKLGVVRDGEYLQLNANQLQVENEYYSSVRPKRVAHEGERPSAALTRGGVEYVELRSLDLSPFDPIGMGQPQQKFLEAFIIYCLLLDSPPIDQNEEACLQQNNLDVAKNGRKPGLQLRRDGGMVLLQEWAAGICAGMRPVCELLDTGGAL
ncbi:MAG: glutamate--cysteine ligase, partial [Xanthomonadales bacterium]|nr:glutamate--cysteine ligase [Xanthomonadales bacterium]